MSLLPTERLLASYWIPEVGIGSDPMLNVHVPLTDILNYVLEDGTPQTNVVFLFSASFTGTADTFNPPYLSIPDGIMAELVAQPGQTQSNVQLLQSKGIKVILSVIGYTSEDKESTMGWDTIPSDKNEAFASWVQSEIIEKYGLDGIDIDDEWSYDPKGNPIVNVPGFMETVGTLRHYLQGKLISKALWADSEYFTTPVSSSAPYNAGAYLGSLLDFGCTMSYGNPAQMQKIIIESYHDITVGDENVGMAWSQLCIGVQAGYPGQSWTTPIDEVSDLAEWVVEPESPTKTVPPILGMMLFTFPQDIQQWTHDPQNSPGYMYPNANDHEFQKAIVTGMWGANNWVVKNEGAMAEEG